MDMTKIFDRLGLFPNQGISFYDDENLVRRKSYPQVLDDVREVVERLKGWGVECGMRVGILATNSYEWVLYDLALMHMRCTVVAFPEEFGGNSSADLIERYKLSLLLLSPRDQWPVTSAGDGTAFIDANSDRPVTAIKWQLEPTSGDFIPSLIFSSGTSGRIKCIITNLRGADYTIEKFYNLFDINSSDSFLVFLPLSSFQQRLMVYAGFFYGFDLLLIKPSQLFSAFKEMKPTLCLAPPLLYETIHSRFNSAIRDLSLLRRLMFRILSSIVEYVPVVMMRDRLLKICYGKVHESLGGRIRIMWTGMAPIKRSTLEFFARARVPLFEAYGLTECGAITSNSPGNNKIGSVGKPVTEGGVFLADDGEIIVRQEHVQTTGYLESDSDDQSLTYLDANTVATGDIGSFDEDGYLYLAGRKNEIIVTGQGYKIHPESLECKIDRCPQVARSIVFGTGLPYLIALISVESEMTPSVEHKIRNWLEQVNAELPPASRIVRYFITPEQFTRENGFMTRSLKLDRRAIYKHFEKNLLSGKVLVDGMPEAHAASVEEQVDKTADPARRAEIEQLIAREWKEVLNLQAFGRNDNFFDLGGNSLGLMTISSRLREIFKMNLPNTIMFQYPTIGAIADYVSRTVTAQADCAKETAPGFSKKKYGTRHISSDIAIIGMSGRFPKARSLREFWHNLCEGVEAISFFTDEELIEAGVSPELLSTSSYVKAGSIINDIESFDAAFFGMNPREAQLTDPQHRLFLESVWEAMESTGYDPERFKGRIGVFAGSSINTYLLFNLLSNSNVIQSTGDHMLLVGNDKDFLATRISYMLNLKGPSITVQTACSTSLVAVHMACENLLTGHCDMAVAGAVTIRAAQKKGYLTEESGLLSPDGHCRAFDAKAMGTVFGNGLGVVVLKRLEDAIADGDHINAVIKGTAINNDGSLKIGYLAPSVDGQAEVIADAHAAAGIDPATITYIEAHGTGTILGDPVEITALTKAFRQYTDKKNFCAIGSVKTNIGHLDTAAGIAGLIKTVLALEHRQIPPSLNFDGSNPNVDFESSPFYVNTSLKAWEAGDAPRRAGVSSFGFGGTNSHVVLEEAPAIEPSGEAGPWQLLVLSAQTPTALEATTNDLANFLTDNPCVNLADVAYTLKIGRKPFGYRRAVVCRDAADAISALGSREAGYDHAGRVNGLVNRPVAFMFAGYGSQQVKMAEEFYRLEPVFREEVDRCSELLKPHLGFDIRDVLYPSEERIEESAERLNLIWIAQPALFVIEYATSKLWMRWGVHPQMMIGHSTGEYIAAHFAGIFSLEDVLAIVVERSRLMHDLESGSMLAIPMPENEVVPLLDSRLSIAIVNGPSQCVVSGPTDLVDELEAALTAKEVSCRRFNASHAYHSAMMEPMIEPFKKRMSTIKLHTPTIPFVSNLTGTWITHEEAVSIDYWAKHLRHTVRFASGIKTLLESPNTILLDIGPGQTLSSFAKQQVARDSQHAVVSSSSNRREQDSDEAAILLAAGELWILGVELNWERFYSGQRRLRVPLPTYPFERQHYWIEAKTPESLAQEMGFVANQVAGKNPNVTDWFYTPLWKQSLLRDEHHTEVKPDREPNWLVFMCEHALGDSLADRLRRDGGKVITVVTAREYGKLDEKFYGINPRKPDDYLALLRNLAPTLKTPLRILHLWSFSPTHNAKPGSESFKELQELGYYSLLFLARALAEQNMTDPMQLFIVADGLFDVEGGDKAIPEKATILGPLKVIQQEYQNITCKCIDVVAAESSRSQSSRLVDDLVRELNSNSPDSILAYRGKRRYTQSFEQVGLVEDGVIIRPLRQRGVYLITGGLGDVGLLLAEHLANKYKARLILTGRTPLPESDVWDEWIASYPDDQMSRKIRTLQTIEAEGGEVLVVSGDVADEAFMQSLVSRIYSEFGQLHGVIHAAGITSGPSTFSPIPEIGYAESEAQFQPKVYGLFALERALEGKTLDFCLLISSNSSVLGGLGFIAYSAANAFMDAFAISKSGSGRISWISSSWDPWPDVSNKYSGTHTSLEKYTMTPDEGFEAFRRIVCMADEGHVAVATGDLPTRLDLWIRKRPSSEELLVEKVGEDYHPRPSIQNEYAEPTNDTERLIVDAWRQLLGVDRVGIHDHFLDLGGNSLLATQVTTRLRRAFNVKLPLRSFFEAGTVAELALVIEEKLIQQLEEIEDGSAAI